MGDFQLFTCDCLNMATMATVGLRQILRVSQGISARGLSCSAVNKKEYKFKALIPGPSLKDFNKCPPRGPPSPPPPSNSGCSSPLPEDGGRFRQHCISSFLGATLLSGRKARLESLPWGQG